MHQNWLIPLSLSSALSQPTPFAAKPVCSLQSATGGWRLASWCLFSQETELRRSTCEGRASPSLKAGASTHVSDTPYPPLSRLSFSRGHENNAGSSQSRLLCSTIEHKLEISTVLHINLPQHNIPATLWTSGHMAIFIEQQGCVPLCKHPLCLTSNHPISKLRNTHNYTMQGSDQSGPYPFH